MKNIYKLLSTAIILLCTCSLKAQNIDTTGLQKNKNGKISFAQVSNAKMADAITFLKNTLQVSNADHLDWKKNLLMN